MPTAPPRHARPTDHRPHPLPCRADPDLFYPPGDDWKPDNPIHAARITEAKALCRICPAADICLADAFETGDNWAILGGTLPAERRAVRTPAAAADGRAGTPDIDRMTPPTPAGQRIIADADPHTGHLGPIGSRVRADLTSTGWIERVLLRPSSGRPVTRLTPAGHVLHRQLTTTTS